MLGTVQPTPRVINPRRVPAFGVVVRPGKELLVMDPLQERLGMGRYRIGLVTSEGKEYDQVGGGYGSLCSDIGQGHAFLWVTSSPALCDQDTNPGSGFCWYQYATQWHGLFHGKSIRISLPCNAGAGAWPTRRCGRRSTSTPWPWRRTRWSTPRPQPTVRRAGPCSPLPFIPTTVLDIPSTGGCYLQVGLLLQVKETVGTRI